jgi:hypothetical protein
MYQMYWTIEAEQQKKCGIFEHYFKILVLTFIFRANAKKGNINSGFIRKIKMPISSYKFK